MNNRITWIFMNIHFAWTLYNIKLDSRISLCAAYVYYLFRLAMSNTKKEYTHSKSTSKQI